MKITLKWLREHNACNGGINYVRKVGELEAEDLALKLFKDKKYEWLSWLLAYCLAPASMAWYAQMIAEFSLKDFERRFPKDLSPRKAIIGARFRMDGRYIRSETLKKLQLNALISASKARIQHHEMEAGLAAQLAADFVGVVMRYRSIIGINDTFYTYSRAVTFADFDTKTPPEWIYVMGIGLLMYDLKRDEKFEKTHGRSLATLKKG